LGWKIEDFEGGLFGSYVELLFDKVEACFPTDHLCGISDKMLKKIPELNLKIGGYPEGTLLQKLTNLSKIPKCWKDFCFFLVKL
jgi:hypothetical protein